MTHTVEALLADAAARLRTACSTDHDQRHGTSSPRLDALLLLRHATGWDKPSLLAHPERPVPENATAVFDSLVRRRSEGEPVAYLVGQVEFYGRTFYVDPRVLIPRPETEMLVALAVEAIARHRSRAREPLVVDVGTGSGAVAVSIAAETDVPVVATDRSRAALAVARENARRLGVADRLRFVRANLLEGIAGPVDVLVANLPYVPDARSLMRDVAAYEPASALRGGTRGTELVEALLRQARDILAPTGEAAVEIDGQEQADRVAGVARQVYPSATVDVLPDGAGIPRVVRIRLAGAS